MKKPLRTSLNLLLLLLPLVGCQPRVWQATTAAAATDVPVDHALKDHPQVETTIAPYRERVTAQMSEVIGYSEAELTKGEYQSPLGNFVVDLLLEESRELYGQPIDMAVATNGGFRSPIPEGKVTMGNAFELMPFENELVVLTLDGPTVQELFDFAASTRIAPMANATYTALDGKASNITINGKAFDPARHYTVLTSDYLANGGDHMTMFSKALKTEKVGMLMRDAIVRHIRELTASGKPIKPDTAPRVTFHPQP
ncbi:5'-nucleotidase C-terminal domain-containing protein [Pontibacter beigongshangensis]|uniref:5'-nucleotidase C-terminal domain-containing protein n=1 Tax=Pontibacter beigongshangensis TaxID=2574733 RepID=UPI00164FE863|nr:5'-nucleotidase [Pontibacter beigongshangensis]